MGWVVDWGDEGVICSKLRNWYNRYNRKRVRFVSVVLIDCIWTDVSDRINQKDCEVNWGGVEARRGGAG